MEYVLTLVSYIAYYTGIVTFFAGTLKKHKVLIVLGFVFSVINRLVNAIQHYAVYHYEIDRTIVFYIVMLVAYIALLVVALKNCKNTQATIPAQDYIHTQNPVPYQNENDKVEKLREYKELLDSCAITQEEFERKKKELLEL